MIISARNTIYEIRDSSKKGAENFEFILDISDVKLAAIKLHVLFLEWLNV